MDLTGTFSEFGNFGLDGLRSEVNVINSEGGVLGHKLQVKYLDSGSDPSKAVLAAKQLLGDTPKDQILFFEPASVGATTEEVLPVTTQAGVLDMTLTSIPATSNIAQFPYNFATFPNFADESLYSYGWGVENLVGKGQKIGVILGTDAGDQTEKPIIGGNIQTAGNTMVDLESVADSTTDFTPILQKMRGEGVNAIIVKIDTTSSYANIMKGVQELNWTTVKVLGSIAAVTASVLSSIPTAVANQFRAAGARISTRQYNPPAVKSFKKALLKFGPIQSIQLEATYADQVRLAVWAAEKAKSNNTTKMIKALETLHKVKLPANYLLALPQPLYSSTVHNLSTTPTKDVWANIEPGNAVDGQWNGVAINAP